MFESPAPSLELFVKHDRLFDFAGLRDDETIATGKSITLRIPSTQIEDHTNLSLDALIDRNSLGKLGIESDKRRHSSDVSSSNSSVRRDTDQSSTTMTALPIRTATAANIDSPTPSLAHRSLPSTPKAESLTKKFDKERAATFSISSFAATLKRRFSTPTRPSTAHSPPSSNTAATTTTKPTITMTSTTDLSATSPPNSTSFPDSVTPSRRSKHAHSTTLTTHLDALSAENAALKDALAAMRDDWYAAEWALTQEQYRCWMLEQVLERFGGGGEADKAGTWKIE